MAYEIEEKLTQKTICVEACLIRFLEVDSLGIRLKPTSVVAVAALNEIKVKHEETLFTEMGVCKA